MCIRNFYLGMASILSGLDVNVIIRVPKAFAIFTTSDKAHKKRKEILTGCSGAIARNIRELITLGAIFTDESTNRLKSQI